MPYENFAIRYANTPPLPGMPITATFLTPEEFVAAIQAQGGIAFTFTEKIMNTLTIGVPQIDLESGEFAIWFNNPPKKLMVAYINPLVQHGVFATEEIAAQEKLGCYIGKIVENSGDHRYAFTINYKVPDTNNSAETIEMPCRVDAKDNRNILAFVNDAPTDISQHEFYYELKKLRVYEANVTATRMSCEGFQLICYIAKRIIYPGEQLLIDYGQGYWRDKDLNHGYFDAQHNYYIFGDDAKGRKIIQKYLPKINNMPITMIAIQQYSLGRIWRMVHRTVKFLTTAVNKLLALFSKS